MGQPGSYDPTHDDGAVNEWGTRRNAEVAQNMRLAANCYPVWTPKFWVRLPVAPACITV
jgi:hypothetical protein